MIVVLLCANEEATDDVILAVKGTIYNKQIVYLACTRIQLIFIFPLIYYCWYNCDHVSWSIRCYYTLLCAVYSPYMAISGVINAMETLTR